MVLDRSEFGEGSVRTRYGMDSARAQLVFGQDPTGVRSVIGFGFDRICESWLTVSSGFGHGSVKAKTGLGQNNNYCDNSISRGGGTE